MAPFTVRLLAGCVAAATLAGCMARGESGPVQGRASGAIIVTGDELAGGSSLLDALTQRVPSLRINWPAAGCPVVMVRGQTLGRQSGSASVYVDETRMRDTCVLLQIPPADVERVELYPVAARPRGFNAGPGGVVLVYRRR
jgi:hypothetical protein